MQQADYKLNSDKTVVVLALRGQGSWALTRKAIQGETKLTGIAAKAARYLGPQLRGDALACDEVRARIAATKLAW
eukprot:3588472-Lingulodinium_polyedra.AAC.1